MVKKESMVVPIVLTTATLALVLGLGIMIEFFGYYTRGTFASPFIHFLGLTWFFVFGAQVANWSSVISQVAAGNIPTQPFILIFPIMVTISLAGMLDSIGALVIGRPNNGERPKAIAKRNPNRGL